jgi:hypothetical protein
VGIHPYFHYPAGPTSPCPAARRRRAPSSHSRRVRPAAACSTAPSAAARLELAASTAAQRIPRCTRVGGPIVVPGRRAQRPSGTAFRHRDSSVALHSRVLRAAAQAASAAWTTSGLTFAQAVLGRGQGVAAAAALIGKFLAASTQGTYQRLWVAFVAFCRTAGRNDLPASPAIVCFYLCTLFKGSSIRGQSLWPYVAAIGATLLNGFRECRLSNIPLHYVSRDCTRQTGAISTGPIAACSLVNAQHQRSIAYENHPAYCLYEQRRCSEKCDARRERAVGSHHRHHGVRSKTTDTTASSGTSPKTIDTTVSSARLI